MQQQEAVYQSFKTEREWLEARRAGLGGSDIAVIFGLNPWKSPLELYAEKLGLVPEPDLSENEAVYWGKVLEQPIAKAFSEKTGRALVNPGGLHLYRHPGHQILQCTIDRWMTPASEDAWKQEGIYEGKTANFFKMADWDEDEQGPLPYQLQLQHNMLVTGSDWGSLTCLIGGQTLKWFDAQRHEGMSALIIEKALEFWRCLESRTEPPADASRSSRETLLRLHPHDSGETIQLPPEVSDLKVELDSLKAQKKEIETEIDGRENRIRQMLGEATYGVTPDGIQFSLKTQKTGGYSVKVGSTRVLRSKILKT